MKRLLQQAWPSFGTLLLVATLMLSSGCGSPKGLEPTLETHPARGSVTFPEGVSPEGWIVVLNPDAPFPVPANKPYAQTDEQGNFRVMTFVEGDGAPEGSYTVTIAKMSDPDIEESGDLPPEDPTGGRYADPATSGLRAQIVAGQENQLGPYVLEISSDSP